MYEKFSMHEPIQKNTKEKIANNISNKFSMNKCPTCKNPIHTKTINKFGKSELYCFSCNT